jgi:acetyltransferase-like isoleucine patch superfamily enzyme
MSSNTIAGRMVTAVHGVRQSGDDPAFFAPMAAWLRAQFRSEAVAELYTRHMHGDDPLNVAMRAVIWRAAARRVGRGLQVGSGVGFKHLETFAIGEGVFIGAQSYLQGRFDGTFEIGDHVWIGPQSYFDARDLIIEEYVGWGPGARVLGSAHTGMPIDVPIIQTDLDIKPVRIEAWADIGTNAVILPGVTVGRGSIVGAGAVVTRDVPPFSVVAGVPARVIRQRDPQEAARDGQEPRLSADEQAVLKWTR